MKKQQGFSGVFILIVMVFCFFSFFTLLKVFPLYTQDWTVESVFETLKQDASEKEYNRNQINDMIQKRFDINGISDLVEFVDVSGKGSKIIIDMEYERRVSLISNIELVATFNHYIDFSE
ncbi:hypothetical protein NBRC116188_12720 [Oceaniserpentilla sp. 4NH20-0058]|uniref:DUF4845 domain-containing protein n=1 Tax=Oceaniserpentilla sp. 4NH20-0058 TaxID=3127660 RepID=UPI003108BCC5